MGVECIPSPTVGRSEINELMPAAVRIKVLNGAEKRIIKLGKFQMECENHAFKICVVDGSHNVHIHSPV